MHSKIYQISSTPISEEDYRSPDDYYDNSDDFADYIGNSCEGNGREECIENFASIIEDVFTYKGGGVFEYNGPEALRKFKQAWADAIKEHVNTLTADNMLCEQRLFRLAQLTETTHLGASSRVDIENWTGGVAYPLSELYEWADYQLKKGDCIYIGAVIDYHY